MLDGTLPLANFVHPNLVALAQYKDTQVDRYGKSVDLDRLNAGDYNISIVISSSKDGATFEGAPGSTLWIDEMSIIYE